MMIRKTVIFLLALFVSTDLLASEANMQTGRYLSVTNKPLHEQQDLLSQIYQVHFPKEVQTVGDAIRYLLHYSGYSLVDEAHQTDALKNTLTKPLPLIDRNFGPMSLRDALVTLAGPAFTLMSDSLNREVNFKLKPNVVWQKG